MKTLYTLILFSFSIYSFAQNVPIDFEVGGNGLNWTWTTFENDTNPPLEIVANPDPSGINTSATVAKFTALQAGAAWAGCASPRSPARRLEAGCHEPSPSRGASPSP